MNIEYLSQPDIDVKFVKDWFMKNDNLKLSLSAFKTMPTDPKSQTTLIKWSRDTMKPVTLVKKNYKGNRGTYYIVKRRMNSLKSYGMKMYPKYTNIIKMSFYIYFYYIKYI